MPLFLDQLHTPYFLFQHIRCPYHTQVFGQAVELSEATSIVLTPLLISSFVLEAARTVSSNTSRFLMLSFRSFKYLASAWARVNWDVPWASFRAEAFFKFKSISPVCSCFRCVWAHLWTLARVPTNACARTLVVLGSVLDPAWHPCSPCGVVSWGISEPPGEVVIFRLFTSILCFAVCLLPFLPYWQGDLESVLPSPRTVAFRG